MSTRIPLRKPVAKSSAHAWASRRPALALRSTHNDRSEECGSGRSSAGSDHHFGRVEVHRAAPAEFQAQPTVNGPGGQRRPSGQLRGDEARGERSEGRSPWDDAAILSSIQAAGPGEPLPVAPRTRLAAFSGHSLDDVRIHDNGASHRAAQMLNARAFTLGASIYFGASEHQPASEDVSDLLAHEVAHTIQQAGTSLRPRRLEVVAPGSAEELEAEQFARNARHGGKATPRLSSGRTGAARRCPLPS